MPRRLAMADELAWLEKENAFVNESCARAHQELVARLQTAEGKAQLKAAARRSRTERKQREAAYLQIEDEAERGRRRLRDRFDMYDMDGSGDIDMHEFKLILSELCLPLDAAQLQAEFDRIDADGSGSIEFDEFEAWHSGAASGMSEAMAAAAQKMRDEQKEKNARGKNDIMHARRACLCVGRSRGAVGRGATR